MYDEKATVFEMFGEPLIGFIRFLTYKDASGQMGDVCTKSPSDPRISFTAQQLRARKGRLLALIHNYRRFNSKEACVCEW
jgi:hypothetical protein